MSDYVLHFCGGVLNCSDRVARVLEISFHSARNAKLGNLFDLSKLNSTELSANLHVRENSL